ncbi:MAG: hypothetical protein RLQ12_03520 [Cyclobacteriaceae bacterium]
MKKYMSISLKLLIVLTQMTLFLLFSACQEEIEPQVEIGQEGITHTDEIAELIVEVSTKDGSIDNIIDRSSCISVHFPISGILEDEELVFNSVEDVLLLGVQVLEIDWVFPITVTSSDHTDLELLNEDMLDEIQDSCAEGGDDLDNECIDFVYPFTVSVFNEKTETVDSQVLSSDQEVYNIFSSEDFVITIKYPVRLSDSDGSIVDVNDNEALISAIKDAPVCDEEDIIDFEEQFENEINELLFSSAWSVTLFEEESTDKTSLFSGYTFQFNQDFTLLAQGPETLNGNWEVELQDISRSVSMEFDTDTEPFILLNEDWTIMFYDQTQINFEHENEEGKIKKLQLSAN